MVSMCEDIPEIMESAINRKQFYFLPDTDVTGQKYDISKVIYL